MVLDGALVDVVGWRATVGHNWGAEHAERWVWLHAAGFEDEPDTWLELAIARVRVGGALTPWIANGAVTHGGQRFRLGGLGHVAGVRVIAAPGRLEAIVPGERVNDPRRRPRRPRPDRRLHLRGLNAARRGDREVLHAGLADVHLHIRRPGRSSAELAATAGGAYELGGSEFTRTCPAAALPGPLATRRPAPVSTLDRDLLRRRHRAGADGQRGLEGLHLAQQRAPDLRAQADGEACRPGGQRLAIGRDRPP